MKKNPDLEQTFEMIRHMFIIYVIIYYCSMSKLYKHSILMWLKRESKLTNYIKISYQNNFGIQLRNPKITNGFRIKLLHSCWESEEIDKKFKNFFYSGGNQCVYNDDLFLLNQTSKGKITAKPWRTLSVLSNNSVFCQICITSAWYT